MVIAWQTKDVASILGIPPDEEIVGVRLSLDGNAVEMRTRKKDAVEEIVNHLMICYGNDRTL